MRPRNKLPITSVASVSMLRGNSKMVETTTLRQPFTRILSNSIPKRPRDTILARLLCCSDTGASRSEAWPWVIPLCGACPPVIPRGSDRRAYSEDPRMPLARDTSCLCGDSPVSARCGDLPVKKITTITITNPATATTDPQPHSVGGGTKYVRGSDMSSAPSGY